MQSFRTSASISSVLSAGSRLALGSACLLLAAPGVSAAEEPLLDAAFSITRVSITVTNDPPPAPLQKHRASDILIRSGKGDEQWFFSDPGPTIWVEGGDVFERPLRRDEIELDAMSLDYPRAFSEEFFLGFSADAHFSKGNGRGGARSVREQWTRTHHEGDIFYSLPRFKWDSVPPVIPDHFAIDWTGTGGTLSCDPRLPSNQTDHDLSPRVKAMDHFEEELYDDIDALDLYPVRLADRELEWPLYLSASSASAAFLPGTSGADIYRRTADGELTMWAKHGELGLKETDEIDALIVFGDGDDKFVSTEDRVLISLAFGSPSLGLGFSPADVLRITSSGPPELFAPAHSLGLRKLDELNAMAPTLETRQYDCP